MDIDETIAALLAANGETEALFYEGKRRKIIEIDFVDFGDEYETLTVYIEPE